MKSLKYLLLALAVFVADQATKWGVTELLIRPQEDGTPTDLVNWLLHPPEQLPPAQLEILPFMNIVMVWNQGITFGLFNHDMVYGPVALAAVSAIIALIFMVWLFRSENLFQNLAIALVIGGALGNAFDRLRFGAVIDFLDFHAFGWHWPAFNLADSCIVVGIGLLIVYSLFFEKSFHE